MTSPLVAFLLAVSLSQTSAAGPECRTWQECREQALAAATSGDFERFHDLAWRAAQRGPKNDPALMALVARAQSLSGRPHDALVMLQRLARMGVVTDAAVSPDFGRVRALPGWPELERQLASIPSPAPVAAEPSAAPAAKPDPPPAKTAPKTAAPPAAAAPTHAPKSEPAPAAPPELAGKGGTDALAFTTPPFEPAGLAYDAVSSRFLVGNRGEHRVSVVGERSGRLVTLSGADSGGFGEIGAIAIDAREGDLWVASTPAGDGAVSTLHKLQLVSGRLLTTVQVPPAPGGGRIVDLVVTEQGLVVALDAAGGRLLRLPPRALTLESLPSADLSAARSLAPARTVTYIALGDGIGLLGADSRVTQVTPPPGVDLGDFEVLRWRPGELIGVQRSAGTRRLVRLVLERSGRAVRRMEMLDRPEGLDILPALTLAQDALFYLAERRSATGEREMIIRRVPLR